MKGIVTAIIIVLLSVASLLGFIGLLLYGKKDKEIPPKYMLEPKANAISLSKGNKNKIPVAFDDITSESGIDFLHHQAEETINSLPQVMGSGACFLDYDGDGNPDIFLVNGSGFTYYYGSKPWWYKAPTHHLYHNNGDGRFIDVSKKAGVASSSWGMGCTVGDYDNDGHPDIYITNYGKNILYKSRGDGRFIDVTETAGVGGTKGKWSTSAAFADYDNDGWLDLYVINYIKFDKIMNPAEPSSSFVLPANIFMSSKIYTSSPNILYRNNRDGTFSEVTKKARVEDSAGKGLGVIFSDLDNDRDLDLYVVNEGLRNILFRNNGNGTFTDIGGEAEVDTPLSGMGVTVGDYDNDGDMDIFSTYPSNETNILYENLSYENNPPSPPFRKVGDRRSLLFEDVTVKAGLGEDVAIGSFGWGTDLFDYDNDGHLDMFVANGDPAPDFDNPRTTTGQRNQLFHNKGDGHFLDVSKMAGDGFKVIRSSRGAAFGDYDNDGDIDIVINNNNDYAGFLRNEGGNANNWLTVRLIGTKTNRDGIGAKVEVVAGQLRQIKEVKSSSSYLSQNDIRLHFGLEKEERVETITILWPSGLKQVLKDIKPNQFITITEGIDALKTETPKKHDSRRRPNLAALKDQDPKKRREALSSLNGIDDEKVIEPIIMALEDPDKGVRKEAASLLCKLLKDEQTILRSTIYRKRLAVVPLIKALSDQESDIRMEAVKALGYSESYRAIVPVSRVLKDIDRGVRREAAIALGLLKDKRGIEPLLESLRDIDEEPDVRSAALLSLSRLGGEITLQPFFDQMRDGEERTRLKTIEVFKSLLQEDESVLLNKTAITHQLLIDALRDKSPRVRQETVKTMVLIKDPIYVPHLIGLLKDDSDDVRKEATIALGESRDKRATDSLVNLLAGQGQEIRQEAIRALALLMDKRAIPPLIKIITDKDEKDDIRLSVLSSLKQIDPLQWSRNAASLLEDPSPDIRREAVRGIAMYQDPKALESLIRCLSDKDNAVRREAVAGLGSYKDRKVVDLLINIIKSSAEEKEIRQAAISSLVRIGDERAIIHLQGIAKNKRDELRIEASDAIKVFNGEEYSEKN